MTDLDVYTAALGTMFEEVSFYARDRDDMPGWAVLLDLDQTPSKALGWLAQFVGVTLNPVLDDESQRARIASTDGFKRGSPAAMVGAARQFLTGQQTVLFRERDGDPYTLTVITYTSETPDSAAVLEALTAQKPAGIILNYEVHDGQDYTLLQAVHPTYADVAAFYASYDAVRRDQPT